MAYDENLAERIRVLLAGEADLVEKRMFGGLSFMLAGNIACGVVRQGLLVRIDPARHEELMAEPGTHPFEMGQQRVPTGWLVVDPQTCAEGDVLDSWVGVGLAYARSLPPK